MSTIRLKDIDADDTGRFKTREQGEKRLGENVVALGRLQEILYAQSRFSLLVILQGLDTSGKDGIVKHIMSGVNPQGCEIHSFKSPSVEELQHDYLWRHIKVLPPKGKIGIFNRSYYEDVTIVRVHRELVKSEGAKSSVLKELWKRRYKEINGFERYLADNHILPVKIFLHISREEQKRRLLERIGDTSKHWKFDVSDIRERQYWGSYWKAYEEAMTHTDTKWAPWHVISANHKWAARAQVADLIVKKLESLPLAFPPVTKELKAKLAAARKELSR